VAQEKDRLFITGKTGGGGICRTQRSLKIPAIKKGAKSPYFLLDGRLTTQT
jgi:hypothetical protein